MCMCVCFVSVHVLSLVVGGGLNLNSGMINEALSNVANLKLLAYTDSCILPFCAWADVQPATKPSLVLLNFTCHKTVACPAELHLPQNRRLSC